MAISKTGESINELAIELEINGYKAFWTMAYKELKAMTDPDAQYTSRLSG